jgi:excisionase family DNA binding protein
MNDSTMSTGKAAKICGVTPDTVLKWIKRGQISAIRTPGGHYRVKTESLKPYVTELELSEADICVAGDTSYCWEYHAANGDVKTGCRECKVFKAKAERCYIFAGEPDGSSNCAECCLKCDYFQYINKQIHNVLVISENEELVEKIDGSFSKRYNIKYTCCGYETATVIQDYHPDYIVIDDSMDKSKTEEITKYMIKDPRLHGAQIILAVGSETSADNLPSGICAYVYPPFEAKNLDNCFQNLRIKLLGLNN